MVLLYDRSSYREKIIHKSKLPFIDWANVDLGNTTTSRSTLMDYFNWTNEQSCQQRHSMNGKGGRFSLCLDPSAALRNSSCLVYSFDFFDDLSFEKEMKEQGCKVYHFDPVAVLEKHLNGNWTSRDDLEKSSRISRKQTHIGKMMPKTSVSIHWAMERLLDKVIHQDNIVDYLKLDIEGEEWDVIPMMIESGLHFKIRQLGVEIHLFKDDLEYYRDLAGKIQELEKTGMVRFHSKETPCSHSGLIREKWPEDPNILLPLKCFEMAWYHVIPY